MSPQAKAIGPPDEGQLDPDAIELFRLHLFQVSHADNVLNNPR